MEKNRISDGFGKELPNPTVLESHFVSHMLLQSTYLMSSERVPREGEKYLKEKK